LEASLPPLQRRDSVAVIVPSEKANIEEHVFWRGSWKGRRYSRKKLWTKTKNKNKKKKKKRESEQPESNQ
jgi:hypothetical protein